MIISMRSRPYSGVSSIIEYDTVWWVKLENEMQPEHK